MEDYIRNYETRIPWYRSRWGEVLIILSVFFGLAGIYFSWNTYTTYRALKKGVIFANLQGGRASLAPGLVTVAAVSDEALKIPVNPRTLGSENAALTLIEFADFGCPFSREADTILRDLLTRYPNRVRWVYRDFPIRELHPTAARAAEASRCAQAQGKFWIFHDRLYTETEPFDDDKLKRLALSVGLDEKIFNECLGSGREAVGVIKDFQTGISAGIRGTPTFFLNGRRIEGVINAEAFEKILELLPEKL